MAIMWEALGNWITLIDRQLWVISPVLGLKPTEEMFDLLCEAADSFDSVLDCISQIPWEDHVTDYETLYGALRAVEGLDVKWRRPKGLLDTLVRLHDTAIRLEGTYPNDLAPVLVHQLSDSFSRLMRYMDEYRSHVRNRIDAVNRSVARPLNILELPNELLIRIFDFVRGQHLQHSYGEHHFFSQYGSTEEARDIQNVRLTCRRFCGASSHLLLDYICLELEAESLSRLLEISQHPTISKGIRAVDIRLTYYHSQVTNNLRTFAAMLLHLFENDCEQNERNRSRRVTWMPVTNLPDADYAVIQAQSKIIILVWRTFAESGNTIPGSEAFVEALRACHRIYQQRYQDQKRLLESEVFVQATATALAQMPSARVLMFEDAPDAIRRREADQPFYHVIDDPLRLGKRYIDPFEPWKFEHLELDYQEPLDIAVRILAALPRAGVTVRRLKMRLSGTGDTSLLVPSPTIREDLSLLAKRLNEFSFYFRRLPVGSEIKVTRDIYQFLSPILDSDSLEKLALDIGSDLQTPGPMPLSIGPVLNLQKRPNLRRLSLEGVAIHGDQLHRLVDSLMLKGDRLHGGVAISFKSLHLLSGSWAGVLDDLRAKAGRYSSIENPLGAERESMPEEELDRIFNRHGEGAYLSSFENPSAAEFYIQTWWIDYPNPFYTAAISTQDQVPV
jgi:hypothetical protein